MKDGEVIDLARQAALFFRRLVEEGVPVESALQLVQPFVSGSVLRSAQAAQQPKDPWEPEEDR